MSKLLPREIEKEFSQGHDEVDSTVMPDTVDGTLDVPFDPFDRPSGVSYRESEDDTHDGDFREVTNDYGFPQCEQHTGDGQYVPVCCQCMVMMMPNRGQGSTCGACQNQDLFDCRHDDYPDQL